ncbi:MAG: hypothetical protein NTV22_11400 [bacterium]|nr:hypothetical protein [bacterium]
MTERRLSGILPIHVADDPVVLAAQLAAQEKFNPRPEYVATMRRKLERLTTKASTPQGGTGGRQPRHEEIAAGKVVGKTQKGVA